MKLMNKTEIFYNFVIQFFLCLDELLKALDINVPLAELLGDVGNLLADLPHDGSNIGKHLISSKTSSCLERPCTKR